MRTAFTEMCGATSLTRVMVIAQENSGYKNIGKDGKDHNFVDDTVWDRVASDKYRWHMTNVINTMIRSSVEGLIDNDLSSRMYPGDHDYSIGFRSSMDYYQTLVKSQGNYFQLLSHAYADGMVNVNFKNSDYLENITRQRFWPSENVKELIAVHLKAIYNNL
jgi:hypothetical protein